jgi:high affinity sulfate transporter 1
LVAGLTLAAYAIPVAVAYASLAGLPPQSGLYCYLVGGVVYFVFGTCRQLAIGPTSAISILIGSGLATVAAGDMNRQMHLAMGVAVLAGFIGIAAWALRLGNITNFVSETVLSGFKVGAGLVIASTQLPKLFGISSSGGHNFFSRVTSLFLHFGEIHWPTLIIGAGALAVLILGARLFPHRPIALVVVIASIALMTFLPVAGIKTVGAIPEGLPRFAWPVVHWTEVDDLLGLALACFLLSYVESISVARTFSAKHGYPIDADHELLAIGTANLVAGIAQGYPLAGGMSQSAVNESAGARTPLSLVIASGGIAAILLFFTRLLRNLPDPVLAAIVLMAVAGLIRPRELRHLYRVSKSEFRIAVLATVGVLAFGILKGVLLASIFSILLMLSRASHPRIITLKRLPNSERFVDGTRYPESKEVPRVLVLRIESGLFYFNAHNVKSEVLKRVRQQGNVEVLVIDLSTSPNIDCAGTRMLSELNQELPKAGASLVLAEAHGDVRDLLYSEGLQNEIRGVDQRTTISALIEQRLRVA